jgi:hypothetical protein
MPPFDVARSQELLQQWLHLVEDLGEASHALLVAMLPGMWILKGSRTGVFADRLGGQHMDAELRQSLAAASSLARRASRVSIASLALSSMRGSILW